MGSSPKPSLRSRATPPNAPGHPLFDAGTGPYALLETISMTAGARPTLDDPTFAMEETMTSATAGTVPTTSLFYTSIIAPAAPVDPLLSLLIADRIERMTGLVVLAIAIRLPHRLPSTGFTAWVLHANLYIL